MNGTERLTCKGRAEGVSVAERSWRGVGNVDGMTETSDDVMEESLRGCLGFIGV